MFSKLKLNLTVAFTVLSLITVAALVPTTNMFGKKFNSKLDFSCCKGDQLYIHHFYTKQFFWAEVGNGYVIEPVGRPTPEGCNIQCED
ncbi:MAG: hypothetical protein J0I09_11920 [Sphingobacteriia bacterium]|nr:hypothetical protein [Sphingobacteriia bacterium]